MLLYDITNEDSFNEVESYLTDIESVSTAGDPYIYTRIIKN